MTIVRGFSVSELKVALQDGRNARLLEGFIYTCQDGTTIEVKAGALSDGASTPRAMWSIIPPFGRYWMPAFLHDALYRYSDQPKDFCDRALLDAMQMMQVPGEEARAIYEGVVVGGQMSFDKDRELSHQSPLEAPIVIVTPPPAKATA